MKIRNQQMCHPLNKVATTTTNRELFTRYYENVQLGVWNLIKRYLKLFDISESKNQSTKAQENDKLTG